MSGRLRARDPEAAVLEPNLSREDLRVLRVVPECGPSEWVFRDTGMAASVWEIAEWLDTWDLSALRLTLNGLAHLEYVRSTESRSRKRRVWWRSAKGDTAVAEANQ